MLSRELLARFNTWEELTRGDVWHPHRVPLEPAYRPLFEIERQPRDVIDDARRPRFFALQRFAPLCTPTENLRSEECRPPELGNHVELQLALPPDEAVASVLSGAFLASLSGVSNPLSFELIGLPDQINAQLVCVQADSALMRGSLRAYAPNVQVRERRAFLERRWHEGDLFGVVLNLVLGERVFRQLQVDWRTDPDPLAEAVSRMEDVRDGELALLQVLFAPARAPWGADLEEFARNIDDVDNVLPLIRDKFAEPTFATVVRVALLSPSEDAVGDGRVFDLAGAVVNATRSDENQLQASTALLHSADEELRDVVERQARRHGMLLSMSELTTLVHVPGGSIRSSRLVRASARTKAAPDSLIAEGLVLGINDHDGEERRVALSTDQRLRHIHLIGASGSGKSMLILSLAVQDIIAGNGFAVLDPHGDLIEDVLARIPDERAGDVVIFDAADEEFPIAFNPLRAHSEVERTLLASDFVSVFRRLSSTTFGDQMASVLGNCVQAFLESDQGGTLLDLRHFLTDKAYRTRFLAGVRDQEIVRYWTKEFPLIKNSPQLPILTRLNTFLRPKVLRYIVGQWNDRLDIRALMDGRKIILAKLSQGLIGDENSHLLGSLLVSKIAQAAMSRQDETAAARTPFALYIDEFHHFVTPSVAAILTGARKYAVHLCLSHQEMRQIRSRSEEVAGALLANTHTRIVFHVGDADARQLADGFAHFGASDLQTLPVGSAIARVGRADFDFNLRTIQPDPVAGDIAAARRAAVVARSRASFATPRTEIEARFTDRASERPQTTGRENDARTPRFSTSGQAPEPLPGRGGEEHKYVQELIRRLGEERGFIVSIEKRILGGRGHVDVALERDGLSVGCEISMSTRAAHEVGNLAKVVAAGFDYAVLVTSKGRVQKAARDALGDADSSRMRFLTPEGFVAFLDEVAPFPIVRRSRARREASKGPKVRVTGLIAAERAASYIGVRPQTLAKMRVQGTSPPFHKIGSRVLYDVAELDAWIAARKRRSTSDDGSRSGKRRST